MTKPSLTHAISFDESLPIICEDSANGQLLQFHTENGRQAITYFYLLDGKQREVRLTDSEADELTAWRNSGRRSSYWDWHGWDAVRKRDVASSL